MNNRFFLTLSVIALALFEGRAQNLPLDPAVRTGSLPNGFTYFIRHNNGPRNRVIFYLVNKAGSVLEDDDQRGLAHFVEHMSFNGTTHFPKNELVNYLQKAGVRFGADINAYTGFDETVYQLPLPSDDPKLLKNGIEIMHDWAQSATLDSVEIDKERGVILEEKRLGKGAAERMQRKYWPLILNNSRYASRIPIGIDEVLNNFQPEAIRRFYRDWYRPDLQALIVVGDIDVDQIEKTVKAKFSDLENPAGEKPRTKYEIPLTGKNQFIVVTDPEMSSTTAEVMVKQPALLLHTAADYRQTIIRHLFNGMMGKRLSVIGQQPDRPFLQASAGINGFIGGLDSYRVAVTPLHGQMESGFKAVWRETVRARQFGFTTAELIRAKASYLNEYTSALSEKDKTGSDVYVKEYLSYFLNGTAAPGIEFTYKLVKDELDGISQDEINLLARKLNKPTDRDVLILAPEKDKKDLPDEAIFNSWISQVEAEKLLPYKDNVLTNQLLKHEPVGGKIVSTQKSETYGISTIKLSNGIKVLLKPTTLMNNEIVFSGFSAGGTSLYSDADYQSASAMNAIPSFGVGNFNMTALSQYLSGKQLSAQPFVSERYQGINGSSVTSELETALQLVYAYFTEPRKDSLLFQGMLARSNAGLIDRLNDPAAVFQDTINSVLSNNNTRRTGPSAIKFSQMNLDKAYAYYKERFSAAGFTFVFVGNIDTTAIKPMLERYLGGIPVTAKAEQAKDLHINIPPGKIERTVYKGQEPKASVNLVFSGDFDFTLVNKLKMDALKEVLEIRLLERLREDESGVYTPSAKITTSKYPSGRFSLTISFGCAPQNVTKLISSALDEVEKIKTSGPTQVNLEKFKAESKRTYETSLTTNGFWLSYISGQLQSNESFDWIDKYVEQLNNITIKDIKASAGKYLTGKNYVKLVLLPEIAQANSSTELKKY